MTHSGRPRDISPACLPANYTASSASVGQATGSTRQLLPMWTDAAAGAGGGGVAELDDRWDTNQEAVAAAPLPKVVSSNAWSFLSCQAYCVCITAFIIILEIHTRAEAAA
jgi:hypothetical protein